MKIAIITSGFLPVPASRGGAVETLVDYILNENEIREQSNDIEVFSIYDKDALELSKKIRNTKIIFWKAPAIVKLADLIIFWVAKNILKKERSSTYRYLVQRYYYLRKCSKQLKANDYEKVILENHPTQFLIMKWHSNYEKYEGRYYYHCHNVFPNRFLDGKKYEKPNKYICVSGFIQKMLIDEYGINKKDTKIVKNGIMMAINKYENIREKYSIPKKTTIVTYIGRVVPEKGVKQLLQSIGYVEEKNIIILIVGAALNGLKNKTNYENEIEEIYKKNKEKVIITGYIDHEKLHNYYEQSDIIVAPSLCEDAAPLSIIEALYFGKPIITTKSGGIPEYVDKNGAIFVPRDQRLPEGIAHAIDYLTARRDVMARMSKNNRMLAKELTTEKFYSNFMEAIDE